MLYVCVQMTEHLAFESQSQNLTFALDNLLTEISYFYHRTTQNEGGKNGLLSMMNFLQLDTFTKICSILSDFVKRSERAMNVFEKLCKKDIVF